MIHFETISDLHKAFGLPLPENPLISLYSFYESAELKTCSVSKFITDFYFISLKKFTTGEMLYGRTKYDHSNGSLSFIRPRQVIELKNVEVEQSGFVICFHEDYVKNHALYADIKKYGFFEYESNEALHLSPNEEHIMWEIWRKIQMEYENNTDEFSKEIILAQIDAMLKYGKRFYKRQFINRSDYSTHQVSRFYQELEKYFKSNQAMKKGLPTVSELASSLNISPKYLSDLLKIETGKTALEHIHIYLINEAKELLLGKQLNISEIAFRLGFENTSYFSRLFRKKTGKSPSDFINQFSN